MLFLEVCVSTIIQIGCNVGLDRVYNFLNDKHDKIYDAFLIEANKFSIEKCKINYKNLLTRHNIYFLNAAIVPHAQENEEITFYYPLDDESSPFVSTNKTFVKTHIGNDNISNFSVRAVSIGDLLSVYGKNRNIEYLYIDTEGLCVDIVDAIDFDSYNIENLIFEYIHSDGVLSWGGPKLLRLLDKLKQKYFLKEEDYDIVATKL